MLIPPAPPPVAADPAAEPALRATDIETRDPHALRLIDDSGDVRKLEEIEAESIASPSPITAGKCPRSPASSASGDRPSTAR